MRRFIIATLVVALPTLASAHSWYDADCCSNDDCKPVADTDVEETDGGWKHLPTGLVFRDGVDKTRVRPSRDRHFHVCIGKHEWNMGVPYCIYIRQGF